jgi:hypothetical protein
MAQRQRTNSTSMDLAQLGVGGGVRQASDPQTVVQLELFERGDQPGVRRIPRSAGLVPNIVQPRFHAGGFLDGVQVADLERDFSVEEGEFPVLRRCLDLLLDQPGASREPIRFAWKRSAPPELVADVRLYGVATEPG